MTFIPARPRPFPHPSWGWPTGPLDLLLTAAVAPDHERALAAARRWLTDFDINDVTFREHRLLAGIAARFGKELDDRPEYPRLVGLQRMLWTKARMAIREALPPLKDLAQEGIPVMLVKGAARVAVTPDDQKARVSHDIDILIPPDHASRAFTRLVHGGWTPATGESPLAVAARLPWITSINLFFGQFGDIDLHTWGYGPQANRAEVEAGLWRLARPADFFGVPVLVPSPADRLALTLRSSALSGHDHSDWVVDCAQVFARESVDMARLVEVLAAIGCTHQAVVTFAYLRDRLGLGLPDLAGLERADARIGAAARAATLLEMKPSVDWTPMVRILRTFSQGRRRKRTRRTLPPAFREKPLVGKIGGRLRLPDGAKPVRICDLGRAGAAGGGAVRVRVDLAVEFTGVRRRFEFELNTPGRHVTRLRVRDVLGRKGWRKVSFDVEVALPSGEPPLFLEARPGKSVRGDDPEETAKFSTPRFTLLAARVSARA